MRVAVIGAGIAGLACAITLERLGIDTLVYEQSDKPGDVFAHVGAVMPVAHRPLVDLIDELEHNYGIDLKPLDPANVLFRQIIDAFAQFEKSRISERMSGGRKQKARHGGYSGGRPALGYSAKKIEKALVPDEREAETVRRLFELREDNPAWTLKEIAAQLNAEGHRTKQGAEFKPQTVKRALDREALYRGNYQYSGSEVVHGQHVAVLR